MNDGWWSDSEVNLTVADYFSMLSDEIKGIRYNKSEHRRALRALLNDRSEGAIEFKHRNISAVLAEMGSPFIKGYLPLYNFQKSKLVSRVTSYVNMTPALKLIFNDFANNVPSIVKQIEWDSLVVPAPERNPASNRIKMPRNKPLNINYLEREQNNRRLGIKGEELAIQYERFSLIKSGKKSLASKIEWVSRDVGDGLGFDILSKNFDGSDKYIEVKTTKLSKEAPFFFSSNEYTFSKENKLNYHLYRIFNFDDEPGMFTLKGSFDSFCNIEPVHYRGMF